MTPNADLGRVIYDEGGTPLCPLTHGEIEWDDEADTCQVVEKPCREELALIVSLRITPGQGDPIVRRDDMTEKNAITSAWEFKCNNGHVLAVSCGEEDAEDFTWLASHIGRSEP